MSDVRDEHAQNPPPDDRTEDSVLAYVVQQTARHLGEPGGAVDPALSFYELGVDSLDLIIIGRRVGKRFGVRLEMRDLLTENSGPKELCRIVVRRLPQPAPDV
ncbi:acyl carrier protein [Nocardiopsis mwathae]|uniref:Acyl carrier protein n=1 Tax=Nocardiopsis mwathae TaxID=1472723 RepID=A0A7W9YMX1_9ACTN|nr:acyl carrier protein [Nocardiopsis mwathae]MBB6175119.1 acyl carrier protein [Nocardiopsis mwathae]